MKMRLSPTLAHAIELLLGTTVLASLAAAHAAAPGQEPIDGDVQRGVAVDPSGWELDLDQTAQLLEQTLSGYHSILEGFALGAREINDLAERTRRDPSPESRTQARLAAARAVQEIRARADAFVRQCQSFSTSIESELDHAGEEIERLREEQSGLADRLADMAGEIDALDAESAHMVSEAKRDGILDDPERAALFEQYRRLREAQYARASLDVDLDELKQRIEHRSTERDLLRQQEAHAFEMVVETRQVSLGLRRALLRLESKLERDTLGEATRELASLVDQVRRIPRGMESIEDAIDKLELSAPKGETQSVRALETPSFDAWLAGYERDQHVSQRGGKQ